MSANYTSSGRFIVDEEGNEILESIQDGLNRQEQADAAADWAKKLNRLDALKKAGVE